MAKAIVKIYDDLSPSEIKIRNLSRPPEGLKNMFINELGQAERRKGYAKYNIESLGTEHPIVGLHRFYNEFDKSKEFITAWNTKLYKLSPETGHAATALESESGSDYVFTADSETFFENFYKHFYAVNGKDAVVKYNGTYIREVGMTVPDAPTMNSLIDGDLDDNADYRFKVTFVDEDGSESNPSEASPPITSGTSEANTNGIKINIDTSSDDKVTKRRIYRTDGNGAIYYYDGEVADNITTTYDSTRGDITLGTEIEINHYPPPSGAQLICKRGNKLYLANNEDLCISYTTWVDYFPAAWFMKVGNRQAITAIVEQLNTLPVFTENSIERLLGTDEDNFEFRNSWSDKGCYAPRSAVICNNLLFFLSYDGLYSFDGVNSSPFYERFNKYIRDNINYNYINKAAAVFHNGIYLLSYPKGISTVNSETVYVNTKNMTYGVYDYAFSCYSNWKRFGDKNELFGGSTSIGRVYQLEDDFETDDGSDIECSDESDYMDFGYAEYWKNFYHLYIKVKTTSVTEGVKLDFNYKLDNETDYRTFELALEENTEKWYKIDLPGGGLRARAIKLKPSIKDKYNIAFTGYMVVFEIESEEYS